MAKKSPAPDLSSLTHEEKDILILTLLARLDAPESKVPKNSQNSSKPPSSDGLTKKTRSLREASGKPVGGQAGHKGTTLRQVAQTTETVDHPLPGQCDRCLQRLALSKARVAERRQVFDVPAMAINVVEHRTLEVACTCSQVHVSTFPADVSEPAQYGPNVRALAVHLTQGQTLPYARTAELIQDRDGFSVSPGTLVSWVAEARVALQGTADLIAELLHRGALVNADESGLRVASKLYWLHIAASEKLTWYGVHAKRGLEAIEAHGILPKRIGVLAHDCWAPYWKLDGGIHALCNAHLLRELVYVKEITGQQWPQAMTEFLLGANQLAEAARQAEVRFSAADVAAFRTLYDAIVSEGEQLNPETENPNGKRGGTKQSIAYNLLRRFRLYADAVLLFISDHAVPFTNNLYAARGISDVMPTPGLCRVRVKCCAFCRENLDSSRRNSRHYKTAMSSMDRGAEGGNGLARSHWWRCVRGSNFRLTPGERVSQGFCLAGEIFSLKEARRLCRLLNHRGRTDARPDRLRGIILESALRRRAGRPDAQSEAEDIWLLPHGRRRRKLLRHPLLPRHASQARPWHARRATARLRRKSYPAHRVAAEQSHNFKNM
jgi:transposase